jgi:hypothetical protein
MTDFHGHLEVARAFLEIDEKFESMESFKPTSAYDMQIQGKSKSEIEDIERNLKLFQNPSKEKIYGHFNDILGIELDDGYFDNDHFTSLGQVVNDRHKITHSDHFLDTMQYLKSLEDVKKHYLNIKEFIIKLCEITSSC